MGLYYERISVTIRFINVNLPQQYDILKLNEMIIHDKNITRFEFSLVKRKWEKRIFLRHLDAKCDIRNMFFTGQSKSLLGKR